MHKRLYHHKTDGGAEYLTEKFVLNPDGSKEGIIKGATISVRIDGDITKDAEISLDMDGLVAEETAKSVHERKLK